MSIYSVFYKPDPLQYIKKMYFVHFMFLAVQNSSIGDLVCPLLGPSDTTNNQGLHTTTE